MNISFEDNTFRRKRVFTRTQTSPLKRRIVSEVQFKLKSQMSSRHNTYNTSKQIHREERTSTHSNRGLRSMSSNSLFRKIKCEKNVEDQFRIVSKKKNNFILPAKQVVKKYPPAGQVSKDLQMLLHEKMQTRSKQIKREQNPVLNTISHDLRIKMIPDLIHKINRTPKQRQEMPIVSHLKAFIKEEKSKQESVDFKEQERVRFDDEEFSCNSSVKSKSNQKNRGLIEEKKKEQQVFELGGDNIMIKKKIDFQSIDHSKETEYSEIPNTTMQNLNNNKQINQLQQKNKQNSVSKKETSQKEKDGDTFVERIELKKQISQESKKKKVKENKAINSSRVQKKQAEQKKTNYFNANDEFDDIEEIDIGNGKVSTKKQVREKEANDNDKEKEKVREIEKENERQRQKQREKLRQKQKAKRLTEEKQKKQLIDLQAELQNINNNFDEVQMIGLVAVLCSKKLKKCIVNWYPAATLMYKQCYQLLKQFQHTYCKALSFKLITQDFYKEKASQNVFIENNLEKIVSSANKKNKLSSDYLSLIAKTEHVDCSKLIHKQAIQFANDVLLLKQKSQQLLMCTLVMVNGVCAIGKLKGLNLKCLKIEMEDSFNNAQELLISKLKEIQQPNITF